MDLIKAFLKTKQAVSMGLVLFFCAVTAVAFIAGLIAQEEKEDA